MNPYRDIKRSDESIIREFSESVDPVDLLWHRDLKNRKITTDKSTDWKIQMENELPIEIDENVIPALVWHRLIKGTGNLVLNITEW